MRPIHKLNGGNGATLCHNCRTIINIGFTDTLYCNKCKGYGEQASNKSKEKL